MSKTTTKKLAMAQEMAKHVTYVDGSRNGHSCQSSHGNGQETMM
jgi:hypothetical protein